MPTFDDNDSKIKTFNDLMTHLLIHLVSKIRDIKVCVNTVNVDYENSIFLIHYYCMCDLESCKYCQEDYPNFIYKPTNFSVSWYKHIGRSMSVMPNSKDNSYRTSVIQQCDPLKMILHCIESLSPKINLDTIAEFTWGFGQEFLLRVSKDGKCLTDELPNEECNFYVWSSPDYDGNNTIKPLENIKPEDFTHEGFCGRDKGIHIIRDFCGENVKFVNCE